MSSTPRRKKDRSATGRGAAPPTVETPSAHLVTERQLAERWKCSTGWLQNQRSARTGCPFVRLGRAIRYRLSDVEAYESAHVVGAAA